MGDGIEADEVCFESHMDSPDEMSVPGSGGSPCRKPNMASLERTSRHFGKSSELSSAGEMEDGDHSDSGRYKSCSPPPPHNSFTR